MYLGLRILTAAFVTSALTFLVSGSQAYLLETRVMFFAWGLFLGAVGIGMGCCLYLDGVIRSETDRTARVTASAVGEAVGEVLNEDDPDSPDLGLLPTHPGT